MLRIRRLVQLMVLLCISAFISVLTSWILYKVMAATLILSGNELINDIRQTDDINKLKELSSTLIKVSSVFRDQGNTLMQWGLGFVLLWSAILGAVALLTYRQMCRYAANPTDPAFNTEHWIDRALAGKLELWKVFWGGYILLPSALSLIFAGIFKLLTQIDDAQSSHLFNVLSVPIVLSVPTAVQLYCAFLVWRSARNTRSALWHYLAKGVVIFTTLLP